MAVQENQPRHIGWITAHDVLTAERVVELARDIKHGDHVGSPASVTVQLNGSPLGVNIAGDPDDTIGELQSITNAQFADATIRAKYPDDGGFQFAINIAFVRDEIEITIQNTTDFIANKVVTLVAAQFPPSPEPSDEIVESLASKLSGLISDAQKATDAAKKANQSLAQIESIVETSTQHAKQIEEMLTSAVAASKQIEQHSEVTGKRAAEIEELKIQTQTHEETARKFREAIGAMEAKIRQFFDDVEKNRESLNQILKTARTSLNDNTERTSAVIAENESLQTEIREHLQRAVGASLFGAFQSRKRQLVWSKWVWVIILLLAIGVQVGIVMWLAHSLITESTVRPLYEWLIFGLRALGSLPVLFVIVYAYSQYSREREYEEMYSFKAALSFSLSPYLHLVKELSANPESEQYREFVVSTIHQIFDNPVRTGEELKEGSRRDWRYLKDLTAELTQIIKKMHK